MRNPRETVSLSYGALTWGFILQTLYWGAGFLILNWIWGDMVLVKFHDIWNHNPDVWGGIKAVWFIFLWGGGFTLVASLIKINTPRTHAADEILMFGMWASVNAGIFEEFLYRWLRFGIAMVILPFVNFLLFGWIPGFHGLIHVLYGSILAPIANIATFGALSEWLFHPASWTIGAAMISANGRFRAAHFANGWIGWINSWFGGMVLFWVMFNYGLVTAITVHILYDVIVFGTAALMAPLRPIASPHDDCV